MYSYSPIKTIQVKNFRNIGDSTFDFNDSPIISLIGENESGKTSVVKAFGVCAMHCDPRSQKDYIRDGTNGFGIAIGLEDGTQVVRIKTGSVNQYKVIYPDGKVWDAQKLENDVPKAVQDVMGLIEEPETKALIHIRTYEDPLLFVVTPASTNYKVMYNALKISQITRAIKAGSTEANGLKAKISSSETSISALQHSISTIKLFDLEPLLNVKNKLTQDLQDLQKFDAIIQLMNRIKAQERELGAIKLIADNNLTAIDTSIIEKIDRAAIITEEIAHDEYVSQAYLELNKLEPLDTGIYQKLDNACERLTMLEAMTKQSQAYLALSELKDISLVEISNLDKACDVAGQLNNLQRLSAVYNLDSIEEVKDRDIQIISELDKVGRLSAEISQANTWLGEADKYIASVIDWMKQLGIATTTCPNCGESVIIDLEVAG